jgi:hypothetical protein
MNWRKKSDRRRRVCFRQNELSSELAGLSDSVFYVIYPPGKLKSISETESPDHGAATLQPCERHHLWQRPRCAAWKAANCARKNLGAAWGACKSAPGAIGGVQWRAGIAACTDDF